MSSELLLMCRHRAARLCVEATKQLLKAGAGQLRFEGPPWNNNTVHVIRTARAHSTYVLHKTFSESLDKLQVPLSQQCAAPDPYVLLTCCVLHCCQRAGQVTLGLK